MKVAMQFGFYKDEGTRDERVVMEYFRTYMKRSGVDIDTPPEGGSLDGFDLVHLFGMSDETYALSREAARLKIPVIVSPFYWNDMYPVYYSLESLEAGHPEMVEHELTASYYRKKMLSDRNRQQKAMLEGASLVLAIGKCSRAQLIRDYGLRENRVVDLPIGIDLSMGVGKPELFIEKYGISDFMLCVGQVTPRKRQHLLIDVARDMDVPLVLIGPTGADGGKYLSHCRDIANEKTFILGEVEPAMMKSAYRAAKIFALPGMFELPGMAYMPAALAGLPVVATNRGAAWDYLGPHAIYCDPEKEDSVKAAVSRAMESTPNPELREILLKNFSWGKTTVLLVRLYTKILEISGRG